MAWSWSHTPETYENARRNLHELPEGDLLVILSEWQAHRKAEERGDSEAELADFDNDKALADLTFWGVERTADAIWGWVEEQAICDNGGFDSWVCPYGCHTVSFDRQEELTL
jgi:hypothetical protein